MAIKEITAKKISQPNAFKKEKLESKEGCSYWGGNNTKYYREWFDINNIKDGKKAQCGSTENGEGGAIKHIGGPTGTFPKPALLHLSKFNVSSVIPTGSEVDHITVTFSYRVVNVTDAGKIVTNNVAENEKAIIQGVKGWFGTADRSTKYSSVQSNTTKFKYEGKDKNNDYIWKSTSLKFSDITLKEMLKDDFALNLQFGLNCSKAKTPCFLYIHKLTIKVKYDAAEVYMTGSNNKSFLYTSANTSCTDCSITQTVKAGYKINNKELAVNDAPAKLGKKIIVKNKPSNVTVELQSQNDSQSVFKVTDLSNVLGEKTVTYGLNNDNSITTNVSYEAKRKQYPNFSVITDYKYQEDFDENKSYIIFKNGYASKINMYIDNIDSTPITFNITNTEESPNLLTQEQISLFHQTIVGLQCGQHVLYFQRGDETTTEALKNKTVIKISPMDFQFRIYSPTNSSLTFTQDQTDRYEPIYIERIDNEPKDSVDIIIVDETQPTENPSTRQGVKKNVVIEDYKIDKYYNGEFYVQIKTNSSCPSQLQNKAKITIEADYQQNYDYLFTRAANGTAFDFDYLVLWEGDNIKTPIAVDDMVLINPAKDIRICAQVNSVGINETGIIKLLITNKNTQNDLKNINIELNTLLKVEDTYKVTTNEWTTEEGIFYNFYNTFKEINQGLDDNVSVQNLTQDGDLIDEENVYLHINTIEKNNSITVELPFGSTEEKDIRLQLLIFETPQKIFPLSNCQSATNSQEYIDISVTDSMQTQLEIYGDLDLLTLDQSFDCPTECYTTPNGIIYRITNIDTSNLKNIFGLKTEIINSNEMIPYGYYYRGQYHDIATYNSHVQWSQKEVLNQKPLNNQIISAYFKFPNLEAQTIVEKTNYKGVAEFYITIPNVLETSYTLTELLSSVLYFKYNGQNDYNESVLSKGANPYSELITLNPGKNQTFLSYNDNGRKYQPGEVVYIPITLTANLKKIENKIIFNPHLGDIGSADEVAILYRMCNLENNEGIFTTTFKTDHKLLIANETSQKVYCGIDTDIEVHTKINRDIVELEDLNVVYINVENKHKLNKDVRVKIDLGPLNTDTYKAFYQFIDINIDQGDYSIKYPNENNEDDNNIIIVWLLGEMEEYQKNIGIIKIRAAEVGLSDIKIQVFDYLHSGAEMELKNSKCKKCE